MRRKGFRECEPITRYEFCQREQSLQIALKPLWRMSLYCAQFFIYFYLLFLML